MQDEELEQVENMTEVRSTCGAEIVDPTIAPAPKLVQEAQQLTKQKQCLDAHPLVCRASQDAATVPCYPLGFGASPPTANPNDTVTIRGPAPCDP